MKTAVLSSALLLTIGAVYAADAPPLREGLWSIHTEITSLPDNKKDVGKRSLCRNHAYDDNVRAMAKTQAAKCKAITDNYSSGQYVSEIECVVAGTTIHTKGTTTRNGGSGAHSESHATYSPALGGMTAMTTIMDQKYVGACPVGVDPGDTISGDGTIRKARKR